jgi:hypothetical protein
VQHLVEGSGFRQSHAVAFIALIEEHTVSHSLCRRGHHACLLMSVAAGPSPGCSHAGAGSCADSTKYSLAAGAGFRVGCC